MSRFGLLVLSLAFCSLNQVACEVYYITASSSDSCIAQPCLTLFQFAANPSDYLHSNATMVFLPGTHNLSNVNLTLSNMDNFVMKSENTTAEIKCANHSHFYFSRSQGIHINNLEFIGCGDSQVRDVEEFIIKDTKFEGQENSGTALKLTRITAQTINSTFVSNRIGSYRKCAIQSISLCIDRFIGGAIIATNSSVDISQSKFEDSGADYGGVIFAEQHSIINISDNVFVNNNATLDGGVLYSYSSTITIEVSKFRNNTAIYNGGVLYSSSSNITIKGSKFQNNNAFRFGGVLLYADVSTLTIEVSEFHDNSVNDNGGVLFSDNSNITIKASNFTNTTSYTGGVLFSRGSTVSIKASELRNNNAQSAGVLRSRFSSISIQASEFHNNSATSRVFDLSDSFVSIEESEFHNNSATFEGVFGFFGSIVTIEGSGFHNNCANIRGVLYSSSSIITIGGSTFTKNSSPTGAVIYAVYNSRVYYHNYLQIDNNSAGRYAVIYLMDSEFNGNDSENVHVLTFANNLGSIVAFNSNITFVGNVTFVNNQPTKIVSLIDDIQEGGAITLFQSSVFFVGVSNLQHNHAENGGAIYSTDSKLYVNGDVFISYNTAAGNGGGVYLSTSELNCQHESTFMLLNNTAVSKGGGLHAISSSIRAVSDVQSEYIGARIKIIRNVAKMGGGLSLEANAKLYILKYTSILTFQIYTRFDYNTTIFIANSADYGGAVYVDDDTNSGTCTSDPNLECFFQVLAVHGTADEYLQTQSMHFSQNYANISGSTLYGGLLDRCAVNPFAEVHYNHFLDESFMYQYDYYPDQPYEYKGNGESYFKDVSTDDTTSISSLPVRVCLCISNEHNCNLINNIEVKKGETFTFSVLAVDQVGQPVNGNIQTSLHFTESGLAEGQLARRIRAECTDLTFNVISPHNIENLTLYASDGPCNDADLSRIAVEIRFLPCSCPIGLQISGINSTNCTCECHNDISLYVEQCDSHTGSLLKQSQSRAWISYFNDTDLTGYLVYPNCPFDYCLSTSPPIDLNQPNGADAQCAFSRSFLLCGSCKLDLSISLGSSRCLQCPNYWPALLIVITIAAILAGLSLVTLLLVLNMTVAVGTINGLIFYANVVYANKSILLPFQQINFLTVFISWLNLDLGIDACYFPGMDTYIKTWLQLAFPAYIILLVVSVITMSSYSTKFSNLIGKKDPVATLATLILLSYAKLLEICFKSLSFGVLEYPNGSMEMLWLPDATVKYLSGKNIPLFIAAVLILLVGLVYTVLLLSWQWLLYLPGWSIFRWSRNPKIQTFIETYHIPYTPKYRYWTGLLLIIRIVLYLIAAVNASNDPTVALISISFTVCCIFALRQFLDRTRMYRKWPVDVLETFFYLNILSFALFTWYSLDNPESNQEAAAYTSVILTFIVLLLIILYHVYMYTPVFSKLRMTMLGRMIDRLFTDSADPKPKPDRHCSPPPDDDIHRFNELLDVIDRPVNTYDYTVSLKEKPVQKPTQSVVEVHQPKLIPWPPDPEEVTNTQKAFSQV